MTPRHPVNSAQIVVVSGAGGTHLLATVAQLPGRLQDRLVQVMLKRGSN